MRLRSALTFLALFPIAASAQTATPPPPTSWNFVVAGDSRNCGDVVMPAIAAGASKDGAKFYWHLGDWRAIYTFDEDMVQVATMAKKPLMVQDYLLSAFQDAIDNQIKPFENKGIPVYAGIGNHETIWPMTRTAYVTAFYGYLNMPDIPNQRWLYDPHTFQSPIQPSFHIGNDRVDCNALDRALCRISGQQRNERGHLLLDRDAAKAEIK